MPQPRFAEPCSRRSGLSLLGLGLALALITTLSLIAIPAYYSQPDVTLDNASLLLARDLRYAQNTAALRGVDTRVLFRAGGTGYSVETANHVPLPNPVGGGDLVRIYAADAIFEGVQITAFEGPSNWTVRFSRDGRCLDQASIVLRYRSQVRTLKLAKGTGMMSIEGLSRAWQDDGY